jgi:hypothetical protein
MVWIGIIILIKLRRIRWAEHIAGMGKTRKAYPTQFWSYSLRGRDQQLGDLGVDGRIILKEILEKKGVDWIHLVQCRKQLQALVNTVMNIRVP